MKKHVVVLVVVLAFLTGAAQNPTYQQKLYYTCKVWGFVKYFHSGVSTCQVNWDSVLIARLPSIKNAVTNNEFNNALDTLLSAAGPMTIVPGVLPDTIAPALKRNRNFNWVNDPILRSDVRVQLDTIRNNFRPHGECWVQTNTNYSTTNQGYLVFPRDSMMDPIDSYANYPDEWHRLSIIFRYWNIINYFNPYNYVLDKPWDSTLYNNIAAIARAPAPDSSYLAFLKMATNLNSAHVQGLTWCSNSMFPYYYTPEIVLNYIPGSYVVVISYVPGIVKGDIITDVDGLSMNQWEDSLRPYFSAGNLSVFRREICPFITCGPTYGSSIRLSFLDSINTPHTITTTRSSNVYTPGFQPYYPNDTLAKAHWRKLGCDVGYVNMGQLQQSEVNAMYNDLQNTSAIIFDQRNYPNQTAPLIANLMYPGLKGFSKITLPDTSYPGTYHYEYDSLGVNGNPTPYSGKVIILMNEVTQSQAEYTCMILAAMPNSIKIGSQTAGADGDISYFYLTKDIHAGFTSLGIYYPNGDSTERIGIRPDSIVYPTAMGIRHKRDELLEKALQVAQCPLSVRPIEMSKPEIMLYPNPATNILIVGIQNIPESDGANTTMEITDLQGRVLSKKSIKINQQNILIDVDISTFSDGMYLMNLNIGSKKSVLKFIKQ